MIYLVWTHTYLLLDGDKIDVNVFINFIEYLQLAGLGSETLDKAKSDARKHNLVLPWVIDWESLGYIEDFNSIFYNENNNANYIRCKRTGSSSSSIS